MYSVESHLMLLWKSYNKRSQSSLSMVPSENVLSPLASLAYVSDFQNRYFFDSEILWGKEAFTGSRPLKEIYHDILCPLLKKLSKAKFVNAKPLSGLHCMLIVLSSYCSPGDVILSVSPFMGGHTSTQAVTEKLQFKHIHIPCANCYEIDYKELEEILSKSKPKLIYLDQATSLFTIDIKKIYDLICRVSPTTYLHVDSSHTNGLILGGVHDNPLELGATSFGGSTHKTFPGPQKAFIATSNREIAGAIEESTTHLVSNCHSGSIIALCITLIEFLNCNGYGYAEQILKNSKRFASHLSSLGISAEGEYRGFTETHQILINPNKFGDTEKVLQYLYEVGIYINAFPNLPGIEGIGFRLGFNEPTRYGLTESHIDILAEVFHKAFSLKDMDFSKKTIKDLKEKFLQPSYCYLLNDATQLNALINNITL